MSNDPKAPTADAVIPIPAATGGDADELADALDGFPGGLGNFPAPDEEDDMPAPRRGRRGRPPKGARGRRGPVRSDGPTKAELMERVAALEGELASLSPERQAIAEANVEHLRNALAMTFAAAGAAAVPFFGEYWALSEAERGALADAWLPVILPHMDTIGAAFPYIAAASTTYSIVAPRLLEMKRRKAGSAAAVVPAAEPADGEPLTGEPDAPAKPRRGAK